MRKTSRFFAAFCSFFLLCGPAWGAAPQTETAQTSIAMNSGMSHAAAHASYAYSDRVFLSGMIPHHEAAVAMARDVVQKGRDPMVKMWAEGVIKNQEAEMRLMRQWLKEAGGEDERAATAMRRIMHVMMTAQQDADVDYNFVSMMVEHHAGAIDMAAEALQFSNDERVVSLAKSIITTQASEIAEYKEWIFLRAD